MNERRYGHFTCPTCGKSWQSAHVYCDDSSCYQQECKKCRTPSQPRTVEPIVCSQCKRTKCTCTREDGEKTRDVNPSNLIGLTSAKGASLEKNVNGDSEAMKLNNLYKFDDENIADYVPYLLSFQELLLDQVVRDTQFHTSPPSTFVCRARCRTDAMVTSSVTVGQPESSHVYCYGFTPKYEQDCRSCDTPCMPYRVEKLICSKCKQHDCICSKQDRLERTIDPNKPHRSDLCHKCQSGNPCM
ncbi:uncharacterized protein LOC124267014 [Haliotis rubra]|uniref:uncharacterized protein LOC124267014 n=1 Tax=Haliotis rubra TaxID=36100 RepID=UPI001EE61518|nr:uncharacterized protein LOC124267014 [Haliotis rubra]